MNDLVAILVGELAEQAADDWVGLWEIPWELKRLVPDADDEEIRRLGEQVVRALVDAGLRIGEVDSGPRFIPWEGEDTVEQLLAMWDTLGRPPNQTEHVWFDLPEQGPKP